MSATISPNKLKFSIFGNGFDDTRKDSGYGNINYSKWIAGSVDTACIDQSETFYWLSCPYDAEHLIKGRIDNQEHETITTIPTNTLTKLFHPSNIANNYGVAVQNFGENADVYIFDLTTDQIYKHFTAGIGGLDDTLDCIMVGDKIYLARVGNPNLDILCIDTDNETVYYTSNVSVYGGSGVCFVDNNTFYGVQSAIWFTDYERRFGYGLDGSVQWEVQAPVQGGDGFPRCKGGALGGNGYIYVPVKIDNNWKYGKFNGNTGGDFYTPDPISTFGDFGDTDPSYSNMYISYNNGRTWVSFDNNDLGLMATNYDTVLTLASGKWGSLATSDHFVIAHSENNVYTDLFRFR